MGLSRALTKGRFAMRDLLELAATDTPGNREEHLRLVFEWYHARASTFTRSTAAAAAAVPAAFIVGSLKGDAEIAVAAVAVGAIATGVLAFSALWQNQQLSHLHQEYILCIRLLHELEDVQSELRAYLRRTGDRVT
jgi:hypothetical protein